LLRGGIRYFLLPEVALDPFRLFLDSAQGDGSGSGAQHLRMVALTDAPVVNGEPDADGSSSFSPGRFNHSADLDEQLVGFPALQIQFSLHHSCRLTMSSRSSIGKRLRLWAEEAAVPPEWRRQAPGYALRQPPPLNQQEQKRRFQGMGINRTSWT